MNMNMDAMSLVAKKSLPLIPKCRAYDREINIPIDNLTPHFGTLYFDKNPNLYFW
jgi:hypothetical protein